MKTPKSNKEIVEIRDLEIGFGGNPVLQGVDLDVYEKENLVVLGKSGTGKSVLIKCMVKLLKPQSGKIKIFDQEITDLKEKELNDVRKRIGFLFQSAALYDSMTVRENLEFPLRRIFPEMKNDEIGKKVIQALENVGLPEAIDKMPSELSGGMRKRIGLARTIIVDPEIILYDEPTTGLDPVTSVEISELIRDLQKKLNTAAIIITHDIPCVRITADRIVMLKEGKVYKEGSLDEFEDSDDDYIRSFFADSKRKTDKKTKSHD
ncbi:ABC transporter ATP-binding protein [Flavobacterium silvaticum]|uniref:ABC transporter ATP-binding protein n=1 Tax=Flavobacterium silvaticum TaxID=1852020 RepID=A0A972FNF2_9FLAO|nr:ABC transporter ATP-binding protein [Flavobacterium silvaticum]NMH28923.1 ABC transporter ATP-binding protein [Flavobacterium silvaticum]